MGRYGYATWEANAQNTDTRIKANSLSYRVEEAQQKLDSIMKEVDDIAVYENLESLYENLEYIKQQLKTIGRN